MRIILYPVNIARNNRLSAYTTVLYRANTTIFFVLRPPFGNQAVYLLPLPIPVHIVSSITTDAMGHTRVVIAKFPVQSIHIFDADRCIRLPRLSRNYFLISLFGD